MQRHESSEQVRLFAYAHVVKFKKKNYPLDTRGHVAVYTLYY